MAAYLDKTINIIEFETGQTIDKARLDPSAWEIMMDMRYDEIIELMAKYPTPMTKIGSVGCARINDQGKAGNNG